MSTTSATLVIDSAYHDLGAGSRAIGLTDRRVLYRVPGAHVELRVMQEGDGRPDTCWLYGMWLDDDADATDLRVDQIQAGRPDAAIASGQRANFALLVSKHGPVTLRLQKADRDPVTLTLELATP